MLDADRSGPAVTPDTFAERFPGLRERVLPRILEGGWFPDGGRAPSTVVPREQTRYVRHLYFGALTLSQSLRVCIEHTRHHTAFLPA